MASSSTRRHIVAAADRLFYQQGFEHTSFADIAEAVAISRGNFYYHFKTQDAAPMREPTKHLPCFEIGCARNFLFWGFTKKSDALAMHVLARSQGGATLASAFHDEKFIRQEIRQPPTSAGRHPVGSQPIPLRTGQSSQRRSIRGGKHCQCRHTGSISGKS